MGLPFASALELKQVSTPANPPAGATLLYVKPDGRVYKKSSAGVESLVDFSQSSHKDPVVAGTIGNITLSGTQTIDGVGVVVGDRVLVKVQNTPADNGIYIVASGAWTRAPDANTAALCAGATVTIISGTWSSITWSTSFQIGNTLGTTAMNWYQVMTKNWTDVYYQPADYFAQGYSPPASPVTGQVWYDQSLEAKKVWAGSTWIMQGIQTVECATTENITLSGGQTIDGHVVGSASSVLVKDQTNPAENGVYIVPSPSSGAYTRAKGAETDPGLINLAGVHVSGGDVNKGTTWVCSWDSGTIGTDPITFRPMGPANVQAVAPLAPTNGQLWYDATDPGEILLTRPAGGIVYPTQNYAATSWVRLTTTPTEDAEALFQAGVAITSGGLAIPVDGWYHVYAGFNFGAGSAGTTARRGIAINNSTSNPGLEAPQIVAAVSNNTSWGMSCSGIMKLTTSDILYMFVYTDVANHYSNLTGARLRAVMLAD